MPLLQIYKHDKDAILFDGHLLIRFEQINYNFYTGFSKNAMTTILKNRGYIRTGQWNNRKWGCQAVFQKAAANNKPVQGP